MNEEMTKQETKIKTKNNDVTDKQNKTNKKQWFSCSSPKMAFQNDQNGIF